MDGLIFCLGCWARVAAGQLNGAWLWELLLWLVWLVSMYGFVIDVSMCWPWVGSRVGWMDALMICLGFCCARVAVGKHVGVLLLETFLWLGWLVFMSGFVCGFPMCWPWVGSLVGWVDGLILCLGVLSGQSCG